MQQLTWIKTPRRRKTDLAAWTCWHTACRAYGVHKAVSLLDCERGRTRYYAVLLNAFLKAERVLSIHHSRRRALHACQQHARAPKRRPAKRS